MGAIDALLARHRAFWRRELDRPLLAQGQPWPHWVNVERMYGPRDGQALSPAIADARRYGHPKLVKLLAADKDIEVRVHRMK